MTTSHSPERISRSASWNAMTLLAQAATWVMTGPVSPYFMLTERRGHRARQGRDRERADLARAPGRERRRALDDLLHAAAAGVDDDGRPGRAARSASRLKSRPAWSTASVAAAIAKWMNRLIRRAILRSIAVAGSKSLTSAAIRTSKPVGSKDVIGPAPDTPAMRLAQNVGRVVADRRHGAEAGHDGATGRVLTRWHAGSPRSPWVAWIVSGRRRGPRRSFVSRARSCARACSRG